MKRIFFKGFAELRAISAILVVFHHIELYKFRDDKSFSLFDTPVKYFVSHIGENAVYTFFVLSGFLITYLLFSEKKATDTINIKKFYLRRILRIWPLYYLILIISFFIIPFFATHSLMLQNEDHYYKMIRLFQESPYIPLLLLVLFLPNFALAFKAPVIGASQSWSVGVEEQFYILWPHIINKVTNKTTLIIVFSLISLTPFFASVIGFINQDAGKKVMFFIDLIPIHYMAIGAIGGFMKFHYAQLVHKIFSRASLFILNTLLLIVFVFLDFDFTLKYLCFGFTILFEIICISQENFRFNLRNQQLEKIGNISYGVYMYHPMIMYACFSFFNSVVDFENQYLFNLAIYLSIGGISFLVSHVSFVNFESKFIKYKNAKFTIIKSGNS